MKPHRSSAMESTARTFKTWNRVVNFTREPIIETIISPKEGCKLLVRTSKSAPGAEEYYVDAVEVVSFGPAFFFRSMERPKAFLVPVSDYEVLEVKETRVALKNVSHERSIKIGGGREPSQRHNNNRESAQERDREREREREPVVASDEEPATAGEEVTAEEGANSRVDKRRDRRRRRHRRSSDDQEWTDRKQAEEQKPQPEGEQKAQGGGAEDEAKVSSQMFSSLIPPPTKLISETISKYKDKEFMESLPTREVAEPKEEKPKKEPKEGPPSEESSGSESTPLNRVSTSFVSEHLEVNSLSSTHFSSLHGGNDSYFL